ncbi:hypothetical protein Tco_1155023 [Tanacetum coccineum]
MSRTIPPPLIPNFGNTRNPNMVENVFQDDNTNNTGTNNVAPNVVTEDLSQLLDSRGGSYVKNVPKFDVKDFTSWKDRFLVYLDGLEPYLLEILENGPFVPKSPVSTAENILIKPQKQWSLEDRRLANQDKRLKTVRLKFNGFKALEGEKLTQEMAKHESKANNIIKNDSLVTLYGKYNYEEELINQIYKSETHRFTIQSSTSKALISNTYEESLSSEDEGFTRVKAFMVINEDEPAVGKADTRSVLHYVEDQRNNLLNKFNSLKQELSLCKSELIDLKILKSTTSPFKMRFPY